MHNEKNQNNSDNTKDEKTKKYVGESRDIIS